MSCNHYQIIIKEHIYFQPFQSQRKSSEPFDSIGWVLEHCPIITTYITIKISTGKNARGNQVKLKISSFKPLITIVKFFLELSTVLSTVLS